MAMIFIMFILNVFVRFVPVYNFTQTDDWIQICLIWMIFLGAQELVRTRNHFVVDFLADRIKNRQVKLALQIVVCLIELATYAVIAWFGFVWVIKSNSYMQSIPWMQVRWMYLAIPVSATFMTLYAVRDLILTFQGKRL
ncbi:TRAP transporter small permease subunit [Sutterella massiliensis]|uniref:TRAP transporter small permease protein n=2 Tax=Sutterella massiliensis TaxID=1816689 RepID=A0ABS2DPH3_9BURK|nr:TRAP transporter small permease subunit [Sutterella massiliensis]